MISGFETISLSNTPSLENNDNPPTKVILIMVTETNLYQVPREIHDIKVNITIFAIMSISLISL